MIQMLPPASLAALDTWPSVHPFGMCGQDGSTTNFGTSRLDAGRGGAAEAWCDPAITNVTTATKTTPRLTHGFGFRFIILILLLISMCDCSDSTGSAPSRRNFRFVLPTRASYACSRPRHNQFEARTGLQKIGVSIRHTSSIVPLEKTTTRSLPGSLNQKPTVESAWSALQNGRLVEFTICLDLYSGWNCQLTPSRYTMPHNSQART